jgi:ElaB/YqjD/DUF883 family membrane-anchored ribosome-binding protein
MAFTRDTRSRIDDAQAQIARLRQQVEALMKDRVTPAVSDFAGRAENAMGSASGVVRDQAEMVSGRVKEQPFIALLIAASIGWIIGRVMR